MALRSEKQTADLGSRYKRRLLLIGIAIALIFCFQGLTALSWFTMSVTVSRNRISSGNYTMIGAIYEANPLLAEAGAVYFSDPDEGSYGAYFWHEEFKTDKKVLYLMISSPAGNTLSFSYAAFLTAETAGVLEDEQEPQPVEYEITRIDPNGSEGAIALNISASSLAPGTNEVYKITLNTEADTTALSLHLFTGFKTTRLVLVGTPEELAAAAADAQPGDKICLTADIDFAESVPPALTFPVNLDLGGHTLAQVLSFPLDQYASMDIVNGTYGTGTGVAYEDWSGEVFVRYRP